MERAAAGEATAASGADEATALRDIRSAPAYQLAMLASLSDRKAQVLFTAKFGVSLGEWRTLANIATLQPVSLAELARTMLLDKGQVSRTVHRLVQRGWVASRAVPNNRRALLLTITAIGREKHAALLAYATKRNESLMSALTPAEREQFMTCLRKLRAHVEQQFAEVEGRIRTLSHSDGSTETRTPVPPG